MDLWMVVNQLPRTISFNDPMKKIPIALALRSSSSARSAFSFPASSGRAAEKPNLLFIFLDDFGWKDTSYMGSDFYETPHLDKLAAGGMIFTNAYSCSANCAPARACLLSGQYTPRHEVYNVGTGPRGKAEHRRLQHIPGTSTLRTDIRTWAHQIQAAGYRTATMGKWHLSNDPIPYGFRRQCRRHSLRRSAEGLLSAPRESARTAGRSEG